MECEEGAPGKKVNVKDLFAGKKGVLIAVPGAFTPYCSEVRKAKSRTLWSLGLSDYAACITKAGQTCFAIHLQLAADLLWPSSLIATEACKSSLLLLGADSAVPCVWITSIVVLYCFPPMGAHLGLCFLDIASEHKN